MKTELLDRNKLSELGDVINKTNIFISDSNEKEKFELICAIMDRFDYSCEYINLHLSNPNNNDEFMLLMMHFCIIKDGIEVIANKLNLKLRDTIFFADVCCNKIFNIPLSDYYGDDKFFEYFRALIFAHPFETTWSIPKVTRIENEEHYSPYLLCNEQFSCDVENAIGVEVYSNKRDMFSILIDFNLIKEYIKNKFDNISLIINKFEQIILDKESKWKERKINRNQSISKILLEAQDILKQRYIESFYIDKLIDYYNCKNSKIENEKVVNDYKKQIEDIVNEICDDLDSYNHQELYELINKIIGVRPKGYNNMNYQLEKIYVYLNGEPSYSNYNFGLIQAKEFSKGFAKKWVMIDTETMDSNEIKMLVNIACYLEWKEQNSGGIL